MIKLIATDMDGTLLNSRHKIDKETIDSLRNIASNGVEVVLNTGRTFSEFKIYLDELDFVNKFVLCNGALILDNKKNFIQISNVPNDVIIEAYNLSLEYKEKVLLVVSNNEDSYSDKVYIGGQGYVQHYNMCGDILIYRDDFADLIKTSKMEKGVMFGDRDSLNKIANELKRKFSDIANILFSLENAMEIIGKSTDKSFALERILKEKNIEKSEIIAIGDGENDIGMIKFAGIGVAMGNAKKEVKDISDFVTKTNDENGIAYVIKKFILDKNFK